MYINNVYVAKWDAYLRPPSPARQFSVRSGFPAAKLPVVRPRCLRCAISLARHRGRLWMVI